MADSMIPLATEKHLETLRRMWRENSSGESREPRAESREPRES
jgi:hypothetical protein